MPFIIYLLIYIVYFKFIIQDYYNLQLIIISMRASMLIMMYQLYVLIIIIHSLYFLFIVILYYALIIKYFICFNCY